MGNSIESGAPCVGPAVGGFVEADLVESQVVAVGVAVDRVQALESQPRQVLGSRHAVEDDRLVAGQRGQEIDDCRVAREGKKGVVPGVDQMGLGQVLDLREVHDHAVGRIAGLVDDAAGEGDLDGVAVAVEVPALALVVRDAMAGVELEAAGDQHGVLLGKSVADYTMRHALHR